MKTIKEMFQELQKIKPKHNLMFNLELKDTSQDGELDIHFTIFNAPAITLELWCKRITIYEFSDEKKRMNQFNKIRKMLSNKRKAIQAIGVRSELK